MARSVTDAAIILTAMAGRDPRDNFTLAQPPIVPDYTAALVANGLSGKRLGVPRKFLDGLSSAVVAAFNASLETMEGLGATIVDPADFPDFAEFAASNNESIVLSTDFKVRVFPFYKVIECQVLSHSNLGALGRWTLTGTSRSS